MAQPAQPRRPVTTRIADLDWVDDINKLTATARTLTRGDLLALVAHLETPNVLKLTVQDMKSIEDVFKESIGALDFTADSEAADGVSCCTCTPCCSCCAAALGPEEALN